MKISMILAGIALALVPATSALALDDFANSAQQLRAAADALGQDAACEARLAENVTKLQQGGQTFSCTTDCVSVPGSDAVCTTTSGFGAPSAFAGASPFAPRGPLGFQLWLPASERGGGFDAAPFLRAFDPFGFP